MKGDRGWVRKAGFGRLVLTLSREVARVWDGREVELDSPQADSGHSRLGDWKTPQCQDCTATCSTFAQGSVGVCYWLKMLLSVLLSYDATLFCNHIKLDID